MNHVDFNIGNEDEEEEESPLAYFKFFNGKYKRVELLAKHLLAIPATSVPSECLFSHDGLINSFLRNRLKPTTLEQLTFVKDNMYIFDILFILNSFSNNFKFFVF